MPTEVISPSPRNEISWLAVREGIQRCIKSVAPTAVVYSRWPLKFDIGRTAELLKSDADNGNIHAWIIGVNQATPFMDRVGGEMIQWKLNIRVWGFIGYEYGIDNDNPQNVLEDECRKIAQCLWLNRATLTLDDPLCLKDVGYLVFDDIDTHGFGQDDIIVARGEIEITLKELL